ncbi:hypothetical protein C8039_13850 [Halogeometricum sp. wsp3]|nr:hypothetical protein C8039_13850 [Halogeometricum sp. wsp3]
MISPTHSCDLRPDHSLARRSQSPSRQRSGTNTVSARRTREEDRDYNTGDIEISPSDAPVEGRDVGMSTTSSPPGRR